MALLRQLGNIQTMTPRPKSMTFIPLERIGKIMDMRDMMGGKPTNARVRNTIL